MRRPSNAHDNSTRPTHSCSRSSCSSYCDIRANENHWLTSCQCRVLRRYIFFSLHFTHRRFHTAFWLGIPFAEPPLGQLRLASPVLQTTINTATFQATTFGAACLQNVGRISSSVISLFNFHVSGIPGFTRECSV